MTNNGPKLYQETKRKELDSPNDFVAVALGQTDMKYKNHTEEIIIDYENRIPDGIEKRYRELDFDDDKRYHKSDNRDSKRR